MALRTTTRPRHGYITVASQPCCGHTAFSSHRNDSPSAALRLYSQRQRLLVSSRQGHHRTDTALRTTTRPRRGFITDYDATYSTPGNRRSRGHPGLSPRQGHHRSDTALTNHRDYSQSTPLRMQPRRRRHIPPRYRVATTVTSLSERQHGHLTGFTTHRDVTCSAPRNRRSQARPILRSFTTLQTAVTRLHIPSEETDSLSWLPPSRLRNTPYCFFQLVTPWQHNSRAPTKTPQIPRIPRTPTTPRSRNPYTNNPTYPIYSTGQAKTIVPLSRPGSCTSRDTQ